MRMNKHKCDTLSPVEVSMTIMAIPIAIETMRQLINKL